MIKSDGDTNLDRHTPTAAEILFIRHNRRFDPDFMQVREIIATGVKKIAAAGDSEDHLKIV